MAGPKKSMIVRFPGGKRVDAHYGDFTIHTDQMVKNGGEASAPQPFDLFFASMATCAGISVLEYCTDNGLSTDGLGVELIAEFDPEQRRYATVQIDITLPAGFPEDHKQGILAEAESCSVKNHILTPPKFETTLDGQPFQ
jgi:ribosomal protein S12 methylthiotransferase accessory factor